MPDDDARAQEAYEAHKAATDAAGDAMATAIQSAWEAHGGPGSLEENWLDFGTSPEGQGFAAATDLIQEEYDAATDAIDKALAAALLAAREARAAGAGGAS